MVYEECVPTLFNMNTDRLGTGRGVRGQSSTLGIVILFGIVVGGAGLIVATGGTAITDTQERSGVERAGQEMTLFDSRAAMVALGNAEGQSLQLSEGSYTVTSDVGSINVTAINYSSSGSKLSHTVIYNETLGSMVYEGDRAAIAYQAGGVWRIDEGSDSATMISPPEFHFRRATLTLPVIRMTNDNSAGGSTTATIRKNSDTKKVYPDPSRVFNGTNPIDMTNPVRRPNATVRITVRSTYADGWLTYFEERTDGVTKKVGPETVYVELENLRGALGHFDMPEEGGVESRTVVGMDKGHPISDFSLTFVERNQIKNAHWSVWVDKPDEKFELHVHVPPGTSCNSGSPDTLSNPLDISIFYRNVTAGRTIHEEWQNQSVKNSDFSVDCDSKDSVTVTFIPSSIPMEYKDIDGVPGSSSNKWEFSAIIDGTDVEPGSTTSFDETISGHSEDGGKGPYSTGSPGDEETLDFVVNHYLGLLGPDWQLNVADGPGTGGGDGRMDESKSSGVLKYDLRSGNNYLTYLHITENNVTIKTSG